MKTQRCAGIAALEVTAERLGSTRLDRTHRPVLHRHKTPCLPERGAVTREDVGEFYLPPCRIRCPRMRVHAGLRMRAVGSFEQIEG